MGGHRCTVCDHGARHQIDRLIAGGRFSDRIISNRFVVSKQAVQRHRVNHVPKYLARMVRARDLVDKEKVLGEIEDMVHEVRMVFDACHEYLLDPKDPTRYFLGPRAEEIEVVYLEREKSKNGKERVTRKRARLSALLDKTRAEVDHSRYRIADPRKLILEASERLEHIVETIADISGFIPRNPEPQTTINMQVVYQLMPNIITALKAFPEALAAIMAELEKAKDRPGFPQLETLPAGSN
jgi:hypothetical protein